MKTRFLANVLFVAMTASACGSHTELVVDGDRRTETATRADQLFWDFLHGKEYGSLARVLAALREAQLENPLDVYTNAHIGWTNFWAFSEGVDTGIAQPTKVLDYMRDAEQAFAVASTLAPDEPRILGFLGYSRLALGQATQDQALLARGQGDVARSVQLWPEWAHFGAAYGLDANAPLDSPPFQQALNHYWQNTDACANTTVDRENPDFAPYMAQETLVGRERACWNGWIAPHNTEGFFLIMGDAMVKAGNTRVALVLYNNAKWQRYYYAWPFRGLLERRIANVAENVARFRQPVSPTQPGDPETSLLANTAIACAICHRGDADAHYTPPAWVGATAYRYSVPF
jgi:hypothetical protein